MKRLQEEKKFVSARAKWWDYNGDGVYFITINVTWKKRLLGKITQGSMELSQEGRIVKQLWEEIPVRFPNMTLDEYVIMPDHFHGILCSRAIYRAEQEEKDAPNVLTEQKKDVPTSDRGGFAGIQNPMLNRNVSTVMRWFKGRSAFEVRKINPAFGWHQRFYDVIIRSEKHLERTREYIRRNPERWRKKP